MILEAVNLSKSFGERLLFSNGSFKIEAGDKIGVIGANGCGKTTLFNIISGQEESDSGGVVKSSGVSVGFLRQHACKDSRLSCYEEALSVFNELIKIEEELDAVNTSLGSSGDSALIERSQLLRERLERGGGLTYRARTRSALLGIGFKEEELELPVSQLSGGMRSKIEICKLLLSSPDIMLLDEPTNHLDIDAIEWLDGFIRQSKSAVVIISHDRYFLDRVANKIISIEHGRIYTYNGNYSRFLELQKQREESVKREYDNTMREVRRIEGIIEQQRRWNREKNIKTAESKQKQIERLLEGLEVPDSELENITLRFTAGSLCSDEVLTVRNAEKSFGDVTLYNNVSFSLRRKERVLMLGKNGCGKTTLIKEIKDGLGKRGVGVTVGYFDQHGGNLDDRNTVFSQLRADFPQKSDTELRCALALFLFRGDEVFKSIAELSGGERARVALCSLMLKRDNFLILDEPTNHLDLASREVLENALEEFEGTILAVSHDRYFINRIADRILYFENNTLFEHIGNYDGYLADKQLREAKTPAAVKTVGVGGAAYKQQKEEAARLRKLKTALQKNEEQIAELELRQSEIEAELSKPEIMSDYAKLGELTTELEALKNQLALLLEEWEALADKIN